MAQIRAMDFEKLIVYQKAERLYAICERVAAGLPAAHAKLADQLRRAALSTMLNIAEGAGEFAPKEKSRIYRIAKRSATETFGALRAVKLARLGTPEVDEGIGLANEVAAILTTMIRNLDNL